MGDKSRIEWTDATWNPVTGCSKVSPGCAHCYAETLATTRLVGKPGYPGLPWTPENAAANVYLRPDRLDQPLRWRTPRRIFVDSMSDLFHEQVPDDYIWRVWWTMAEATRHTFQVLTKRPERMAEWVTENVTVPAMYGDWTLSGVGGSMTGWTPNVWLGTSIENDRWTHRADALRETPAAVRFLSLEPLLGPLPSLDLTSIGWVVVGGESGPGHRSMDPAWVRDIRDRCVEAGVPFLFKQWGGRTSKAGGRELDGRTWDEYPR